MPTELAGQVPHLIILDEALASSNNSDRLDHIYCDCDPDTALCGANIAGHSIVEDVGSSPDLCLVCNELTDRMCENCGAE